MTISDEVLQAYLEGELSGPEVEAVELELQASPALRRREAELRALLGDCVEFFSLLDDGAHARASQPVAPVAPAAPDMPARPPLRLLDGGAAGTRPRGAAADGPATARPPAPPAPPAPSAESAARRSPRTPWLRVAAVLVVLAGAGTLIGRGLALRPGPDDPTTVVSTDPAATGTTPPAAGEPPVVAAPPASGTPPRAPVRPAPGTAPSPEPATAAPIRRVEISAPSLRVVSTLDRPGTGDAVPSGQRTYELASGARVELAYGGPTAGAAAPAASRAELLAAVEADQRAAAAAAAAGPGARPPAGVTALGHPTETRVAGEPPRCPDPVRWRDASGVELRLHGPVPCSQLRAIAARMIVTAVEP